MGQQIDWTQLKNIPDFLLGPAPTWISTSTPPDGFRTSFYFPSIPKVVAFNGLLKFPPVGYTLVMDGSQAVITFKDELGNTIIPSAGEDIRAQVI